MTRRSLVARLDARRVEEAIARAESAAGIELRVSVAGLFWGSCQRVAEKAFARMGMTATRGRNGILLLLAPWRRRVVLLADRGITDRVDPSLWSSTVERLSADFRASRFTDGLVRAIGDLAAALATDFPPPGRPPDELPNRIDRGR
jgi:uncharacterized membrane protein